MSNLRALLLLFVISISSGMAAENGLARTPPMGWDPFNYPGFRFSEAAIKAQAEAIIAKGMRDAGYIWIGWGGYQGEDKNDRWRNPDGSQNFSSARINLMPWMRERDLEVQFYCHPWMVMGHEESDAQQVVNAGFKRVDIDNIYVSIGGLPPAIKFAEALINIYNTTGKAVLVYTNVGAEPHLMPRRLTNMQRVAPDLSSSWENILSNINAVSRNTFGAGPGCYNNLDILWVGTIPYQEAKSQFSMWCMAASVLTASLNVATMSAQDSAILLNREMIAVNQDSLGIPATVVKTVNGSMQIWARPLKDGTKAVALFNPTNAAGRMTVNWTDVGYPAGTKARLRDLWKHENLGEHENSFSSDVPARGVVVLKIDAPGSVGIKPKTSFGLSGNKLSPTRVLRISDITGTAQESVFSVQGQRLRAPTASGVVIPENRDLPR